MLALVEPGRGFKCWRWGRQASPLPDSLKALLGKRTSRAALHLHRTESGLELATALVVAQEKMGPAGGLALVMSAGRST